MQDFRFLHGCQLRALLAPLIVGTIGQEYNYHLGFSLAAIGMFFDYYNTSSKDARH